MKNLMFTLWMLLFPVMDDVSEYLRFKAGLKETTHSKRSENFAAAYMLATYLIVARLLFES